MSKEDGNAIAVLGCIGLIVTIPLASALNGWVLSTMCIAERMTGQRPLDKDLAACGLLCVTKAMCKAMELEA